jgi:hypothetical protein
LWFIILQINDLIQQKDNYSATLEGGCSKKGFTIFLNIPAIYRLSSYAKRGKSWQIPLSHLRELLTTKISPMKNGTTGAGSSATG